MTTIVFNWCPTSKVARGDCKLKGMAMVPSYLNGMFLSEAVERYKLQPNEEATMLDYLMGEAEFVLKFVHDTKPEDDTLEHAGTLRVKLRNFSKSAGQMMVVVSDDNMPGVRVTEKLLTLYFENSEYLDGASFCPIKEINGLEFDPNYKTSIDEWTNVGVPSEK